MVVRVDSDEVTGFLEICVIPPASHFGNAERVADWLGIKEETRKQLYRAILEVVHARVIDLKEGERFEGVEGTGVSIEHPIIGLKNYQSNMQERNVQAAVE